ncbi:MAG: phytase, partial [Bacteroidota bacterium]
MIKIFRTLAYGLLAISVACQSKPQNPAKESEASGEAREDSLALLHAYELQAQIKHAVYPMVETQSIAAQSLEDAADDPALWLHPDDPAKSLIYGSNKKGGLATYDLSGKEVAYYPIGKVNNVDVLQQLSFGERSVSILGCSNRTYQGIDIFLIDETDGSLTDLSQESLTVDPAKVDDVYGFCFGRLKDGKIFAILNGKNGLMQQFELVLKDSAVSWILRREYQSPSQTEGMVVDELLGDLYVGQEDGGIWKLKLDPKDATEAQKLAMSGEENPAIAYDIEGLSIYRKGEQAYLMASSQG